MRLLMAAGVAALVGSCSPGLSDPDVAIVSAEPRGASGRVVCVAPSLEGEVLAAINRFRAEKRRKPFQRHTGLDQLASEHAEEMARKGKMSHAGFDDRVRRAQQEYGLVWTVENVLWGKGYPDRELAGRIVNGWIESRGHRKNLLERNTQTGIGIARGGDGSFWAAQLSGRPRYP